jgi:hypothetical protein
LGQAQLKCLAQRLFSADGQFGSLDGQGNQVDGGTYRITGPNKVVIPRGPPDLPSVVNVTFRFTISDGGQAHIWIRSSPYR